MIGDHTCSATRGGKKPARWSPATATALICIAEPIFTRSPTLISGKPLFQRDTRAKYSKLGATTLMAFIALYHLAVELILACLQRRPSLPGASYGSVLGSLRRASGGPAHPAKEAGLSESGRIGSTVLALTTVQ